MNKKTDEKVGEHKKFSKISAFGISVLLTFLNILPSPLAFAGGDTISAGSQTTAVATKTPGQTTDSDAKSPTRTVYTLGDSSPISRGADTSGIIASSLTVLKAPLTAAQSEKLAKYAKETADKMAAAAGKATAAAILAQQARDKAAAALASAEAKVEKAKASAATAQETKPATAKIAADKKILADKAVTEAEASKKAAIQPETDAAAAQAEAGKTKTAAAAALQIKTAAAKVAKEKKTSADKALAASETARKAVLRAHAAEIAAFEKLNKALKAAGLPIHPITVVNGAIEYKEGAVAVELNDPPPAVVKGYEAVMAAQQARATAEQIAADKKAAADKAVAEAETAKKAAVEPEADAAAAQAAYDKAKIEAAAALKIKTETAKISKDKQALAKKASAEADAARKAALKAETALTTAQTAVEKAEAALVKAQQTEAKTIQTLTDKKALADQTSADAAASAKVADAAVTLSAAKSAEALEGLKQLVSFGWEGHFSAHYSYEARLPDNSLVWRDFELDTRTNEVLTLHPVPGTPGTLASITTSLDEPLYRTGYILRDSRDQSLFAIPDSFVTVRPSEGSSSIGTPLQDESDLIALINNYRRGLGLALLAPDRAASLAADRLAGRSAARGYIDLGGRG